MDVKLLGSVQIFEQGRSYLPSAPKQKQLLSLLMVNFGRPVSIDSCIEELWRDAPPRSALTTIHTYIMQIRKSLARIPSVGSLGTARRTVATRGRGYAFQVDCEAVDLHRFRCAVSAGRQALRAGNDVEVMRYFRHALGQWDGDMLVDVPVGPVLSSQIIAIEQQRLTVMEQCIDAELRLGAHHELIHELTGLVQRYPMNENLTAQYMLALYRSGRQAEALEAYHALRQALTGELGVEPSKRIRGLQQAILASDPGLDVPHTGYARLSLDLAGSTSV